MLNCAALKHHLEMKLAYTNTALVRCTIVVMFENSRRAETGECPSPFPICWRKGIVQQFTNPKHAILFVDSDDSSSGEILQIDLSKQVFCIKERPRCFFSNIERLGEEIIKPNYSINYILAQSLLATVFGVQETGHRTVGHRLVSSKDVVGAQQSAASLLYGEILSTGIHKALDASHLDAVNCKMLLELGSGLGKLAIQAFLEFPNLCRVIGVEFAEGRYRCAKEALNALSRAQPDRFRITAQGRLHGDSDITSAGLEEKADRPTRSIHFELDDFFLVDKKTVKAADIIIMETDISESKCRALFDLLSHMHVGAKLLTYVNLNDFWARIHEKVMFRQLTVNISLSDRFATTWSPERGHHFFLWEKLP